MIEVLAANDDEIPRVVRFRHGAFDEARFPGMHCLDHSMDDKSISDNT